MKLELQPLCDRALADIRGKITLDNVVNEVFSWVTAGYVTTFSDCEARWYELIHSFSQKEIVEMQSDLLISKFKDPRTIAAVKEKIRHISDGTSSHRAGALQLGFEKAFELRGKKKQPQPQVVRLVCNNYPCPRRGMQVTCSSLSNNCCPVCKSFVECANCRQLRTGNYLSCLGCKMKFV